MGYESAINRLTTTIEIAGTVVLVIGAVLATGAFLRAWRRQGIGASYTEYRANLGRAILLSLEILIIADIIHTIAVEPTLENLGVLAVIVAIRTFLSFSLEIEIDGALPWRRGMVGHLRDARSAHGASLRRSRTRQQPVSGDGARDGADGP
jgi:uncharacterized membrane protein